MKNLIKLQLRNLFHSKMLYVCTLLLFLSGPLFSFVSSFMSEDKSTYAYLPQLVNLIGSGISIVAVVFVSIFGCLDHSEGTAKNIIGRGFTRWQLLMSKYVTSLVGVFAMYLIVAIVSLPCFIPYGIGNVDNLQYILAGGVFTIFVDTIFCTTVAFIAEKTGTSIAANLVIPTFITLGLTLADANLKFNISDYWYQSFSQLMIENHNITTLYTTLIGFIAYVVIFVFIGQYFSRNKEVK